MATDLLKDNPFGDTLTFGDTNPSEESTDSIAITQKTNEQAKDLKDIDLKVQGLDDNSNQNKTSKSNGEAEGQNETGVLSERDLTLAATLVLDAKASRNLYFKTDERSLRWYKLYNHFAFKLVLFLCIWCIMLLAIFEEPAVPGVAIPYWGTMIMEMIFTGYLLFRLIHHCIISPQDKFWRDPKNITVIVVISLTVIDIICYIIWKNVATPAIAATAVRWSRPLRPLYMVNFPQGRQIRKAFRNIRRTIPDIAHVLVLFISSIALFALLAMKLHQRRALKYPDGRPYFDNYWESFWDLYVLVTSANNPDVMMPAYDHSNWFALFYIIFTIINLYIFMSIILAVVYNNYKKHLKNEVKTTVYLKRRILGRAFDLLKTWQAGRYLVTKERWYELMKMISPKRSDAQLELLLYVLDDTGDEVIVRREFLKLADLLNIDLAEITEKTNMFEQYIPKVYLSKPSEILKMVVRHRFFRWFYDMLIFVNAICIGLSIEEAEWYFLGIFIVEILLKVYTLGVLKYFKSLWNAFDFIVVISAAVVMIVESALGETTDTKNRTLDFILVLRCLRLVRIVGAFERFQVILTTIVNIAPSILIYGGVIFVFYYIYAIIGMEVFKGRITYSGYNASSNLPKYCSNDALKDSEFWSRQYCNNNFNDFLHALVVLFELMVVNQWHVLSEGFVLVTNKAARLYFISFHMICVVILLNIFTAFVLEVFLLEYSLSKGKLEDVIESKIKDMGFGEGQNPTGKHLKKPDQLGLVEEMEEDHEVSSPTADTTDAGDKGTPNGTLPGVASLDPGHRFKLKKKNQKKVENVLQRMFEGELDPNDEGPEEEMNEGMEFKPSSKLTLDSVA